LPIERNEVEARRDRRLNINPNKEFSMIFKHSKFVAMALAGSMAWAGAALADDHSYTEGPVVNVSRIRTVDGHFDDYMNFVATKWKAEQEAAKKAGDVLSYQVLTVEPRTPDDPDLYLVITFKNWAALDGSIAKNDAIAKAVDGSVSAANKGEMDRASIRRVLGSETMQVLNLK
jgi:hypothetical protein